MRKLTEERRQAIVAAAAEVFQEIGYKRASMNEVAKRAGGSKATLYNYFPSKEALFETVVRHYSVRFLADAADGLTREENKTLPLEQKLIQFGENMLKVMTCDNQALQIYRVVLAEASHSSVGELFLDCGIRQSLDTLAKELSEAMQRGELTPADPMLRALQFTALIKAETEVLLFLQKVPQFSTEQVNQMVRNGVQLFLKGAV